MRSPWLRLGKHAGQHAAWQRDGRGPRPRPAPVAYNAVSPVDAGTGLPYEAGIARISTETPPRRVAASYAGWLR